MSFRTWLLAGTSLSILALAPLSVAQAQDATNAALVAAYQAYQADQSDAAKQKLTEACIAAGFQSLDDCIAALSGTKAVEQTPAESTPPPADTPAAPASDQTPAQPEAAPAQPEPAPAQTEQAPAAQDQTPPAAAPSSSSEEAPAQQAPAAPDTKAAPQQDQAPASSDQAAAPTQQAAPAQDQTAPSSSAEQPQAPAQQSGKGAKQLAAAVNLYNQGAAELDAGNADGQAKVDKAKAQIDKLCADAGFTDIDACLAQFNLTLDPLPSAAAAPSSSAEQAASSEQPPASTTPEVTAPSTEPSAAPASSEPPISELPNASEAVTPSAVEVLPPSVKPADAAPLTDSGKDAANAKAAGDASSSAEPPPPATPPAPPPTTDKAAQADIKAPPADVQSTQTEKGKRHQGNGDKPPVIQPTPPTDNPDVKVVQQPKDDKGGLVFSIGVNIYINNPDQERDRFYDRDRGDQIYYDDLSRGRTRETIVRKDGTKVVTIRSRDGDVLQRSKILPNGREIIISSYDPKENNDDNNWRDPGDDLPPLQLNIPASQYILDADSADEADVQTFLDQPPVEQVRRIYTIDEVKRSARLRDSVRRLEVGGLTFDTGKATISRDQVGALSKVADAMQKLLAKDPGEVFLIEGHTDAVGSDVANLVLSDQRASTVARILTDFYDIPPENLVTQGYGERYLKVKTDGPEPLNRRVTIKNISTLVSYVGAN